MNEFYYRSSSTLGQNLFCCPCSALVTDLSGKYFQLFCSSVSALDKHFLHYKLSVGNFDEIKFKFFTFFWIILFFFHLFNWKNKNKKIIQVKRLLHIGIVQYDVTIISKIAVCCIRTWMPATSRKWYGWKQNTLASVKQHQQQEKYLLLPFIIRQVSTFHKPTKT